MALKVWHLCSNRWNSAITEYALSAARAMQMVGYTSRLGMLAGSPGAERAVAAGVAVDLAPGFGLAHIKTWRAAAAKFDPDIVITYGGPETTLLPMLPLRRETTLWRFRGQDVEGSSLIAQSKFYVAHRRVDALLAPSDMAAQRLRLLTTSKPIYVVPLGIDATRFKPSATTARRDIVILGRLDPIKGHARALALFKQVLALGEPKPRLHIIGKEQNLSVSDLEGIRAKLGLTDADVKITATRIENVEQVLADAALGWVPSLGSEIICRVAEEFLLCGTPVVVSGAGSLANVLFDEAGAHYRGLTDSQTAELVKRWWLQSLVETPAAKQGRAEHARQLFSLASMGKLLAELIKKHH